MRVQNLTTILFRASSINTVLSPLRRQTAASSRYFSKLPFPVSGANVLKAAPTIPFFSSFFSSSASAESNESMSYPDQRSEDQWRAVLSPGSYIPRVEASQSPIYFI